MNSLPKKGGIHPIISPRELVTGKKLRVPSIHIGQYVQGHTGGKTIGSNDTAEERSIDALYIGRADNGSGHIVFKLSTKQPVSVNRVTVIPPTTDHIKFVNDMADAENQPEGIEFADINGKVTLDDFIEGINDGDDDSNASDDDFEDDIEYQQEYNDEAAMELDEGLAVNEEQTDAFNNDLRQLVHDPANRVNLQPTRLRPRPVAIPVPANQAPVKAQVPVSPIQAPSQSPSSATRGFDLETPTAALHLHMELRSVTGI
jgi:hypothetical protein